jgi:hypothetical protein
MNPPEEASTRVLRERYPSLAAFYNADPARLGSREQDVGLWWRDGAEGPLHRAAWVADTGELYLARLGPPSEGGGRVELLAKDSSRERIEQALGGWQERCGAPGSLQWLRTRLAALRRPALGRQLRARKQAPAGAAVA